MEITSKIDKLLRGTIEDHRIALEILKSQGFADFDAITYTYRYMLNSLIVEYFNIEINEVDKLYDCLDMYGDLAQTFVKIISWK